MSDDFKLDLPPVDLTERELVLRARVMRAFRHHAAHPTGRFARVYGRVIEPTAVALSIVAYLGWAVLHAF